MAPMRKVTESPGPKPEPVTDSSACSSTAPAMPAESALPTAVVRCAAAPSRVMTVAEASEGVPAPCAFTATTLKA